VQDLIRQILPEENRWCAFMRGFEVMLTAHIEAATGTKVSGPMNYNFPARTADEIAATQGQDATRIRSQRPTEMTRELPGRQAPPSAPPSQSPPTQPARRMKTPW